MNDLYSKTMLGVITLCLLALVAQGYGLGTARTPAGGESRTVQERYKLVPVAMSRTLLRIDLETGETWQAPLLGAMRWRPVQEFEPAAQPEPAAQTEPAAEAAPPEPASDEE